MYSSVVDWAQSTNQITNAQQMPYTTILILKKKKKKKFSGEKKRKKKKGRRMDHSRKNVKKERARGLYRKTRDEIGKGNQMTALRFLTGVKTSEIPGFPSTCQELKLI